MTEEPVHENDIAKWEESFDYLPFGASEQDIASASTNALKAAYALMQESTRKPPGLSVPWLEITEGDDPMEAISARVRTSVLNESLRYSRVCRELSDRVKNEDPNSALELLESALLPASSALAFETHESYMTFMKMFEAKCEHDLEKLRELASKTVSAVPPKRLSEQEVTVVVNLLLEVAVNEGLLHAAYRISELEDSWNFYLKASMTSIAEAAKLREKARDLARECLEMLSVNDELLGAVFNSFIQGYRPANGDIEDTETLAGGLDVKLSHLLDSKLRPLLQSVEEGLKIGQAVQSRLDYVVETLIDLNERSKLTWSQIRRVAHAEPNYDQERQEIEASLEKMLEASWRRLKADSRRDLIDSEFVLQQVGKWQSGWRMAVLGYCTTVERELRITYQVVRDRLFKGSDGSPTAIRTIGDAIEAFPRLASVSSRGRSEQPADILVRSMDELSRLNGIRARAAHSKDLPVSQEDASWIRHAVIGRKTRPLLELIVSTRVGQ